MSERILKALMQLFAIISESEDEGVSMDRRRVVELFLKMQLNKHNIMIVAVIGKIFHLQLSQLQLLLHLDKIII